MTSQSSAFLNGGVPAISVKKVQAAIAAKGDTTLEEDATKSLEAHFFAVIAECKNALYGNDQKLRDSDNWALGVSILGLVAGVGGAALSAKTNASRSAIATLSGIAGSTNALQNQLKDSGRDSEEYQKRSTQIREIILEKTKKFNESELQEKLVTVRELTASCIAYS